MGSVDTDELTTGDGTGDVVYRWTIRGLYAVAIALNVWMLWDAMSDDTDTERLRIELRKRWRHATSPFHYERWIKKETGHVIFEAIQVVEDASA